MANSNNRLKATTIQPNGRKPADETEKSLEHIKYVYDLVNGWIENADNKVSISCGLFVGVFGVVTFLAERFPNNPVVDDCWKCLFKVSFVLGLIAMGFSVYFYAMAIIPNLKSTSTQNASKKKYPVFYGDINTYELIEYQELMKKGNDKEFNDEIVCETWYNSRVCMKKMLRYRRGVISSLIAIAFAFLSLLAHILD